MVILYNCMRFFFKNESFGRDGWLQPSALVKSGAVGHRARPFLFFMRSSELEKLMGHSQENRVLMEGRAGDRRRASRPLLPERPRLRQSRALQLFHPR